MPRAVLFDLDDTLYRELDFVHAALESVAREIEARCGIERERASAALRASLEAHGRGRTIDRALEALGAGGPELVAALVRVYRGHEPQLTLHPDARRALDALAARGVVLGLITDGDPAVQRAKARALELSRWMSHLRFTWDDGAEHQKPHPLAYRRALDALGIAAGDAIYVGDNPAKDFVGARALGLGTVRVLRGPYREVRAPAGHDADLAIESLDALV